MPEHKHEKPGPETFVTDVALAPVPEIPWHQGRIPTPGQAASVLWETLPQIPGGVIGMVNDFIDTKFPEHRDHEMGG